MSDNETLFPEREKLGEGTLSGPTTAVKAPKVINIRDTNFLKTGQLPANSVYVGRANFIYDKRTASIWRPKQSKWHNPYREGVDGTKHEVIEKFRARLMSKPELLAQIEELRGKDLACHCFPKRCHAEVLLKIANEPGN